MTAESDPPSGPLADPPGRGETGGIERVADLLGAGGAVARRLPDYEERPEQLALAERVEGAFAAGRHLLAEAGTGIGKSFAYLLPAVLHADGHRSQGPVVVSTRTIALQQQLELKDIPFLQGVLPLEWSAVTALGRNNYLCLRRMHRAGREQGLFEDPHRRDQLATIVSWSLHTEGGTRLDLPAPVDPAVWDEVQAESGNCLQRACPHYDECPYQRARRRMDGADVLIVNHALYMADLALRRAGTGYLPDHRFVVFDEAHHLERVATEALGARLAASTVHWHLRRLYGKRRRSSPLARFGSARALTLWREVRIHTDAFFADLDGRLAAGGEGDGLLLGDETLQDPLSPVLGTLLEEVEHVADTVTAVDDRMELRARAQGLAALQATIAGLCSPQPPAPVRWLERERRGPVLRSAPLTVAPILREHLFRTHTTVLVSATLGPGQDDSFSWMRQQLGIDHAQTARLGSPFDFDENVELILEEALPDPGREPRAFDSEMGPRVLRHVLDNGGHALILCTSWRSVHALAEELRAPLAQEGLELLVQGEAPLARLLDRKRAEPESVLLGTDSLWEGIDLPGEALTLVVVTRLPFANPSHPLTRARLDALAAEGEDPFRSHSLPEALLRFRQGFGRLVRSRNDHGKVVVCDPRVRTKAYGRAFLRTLPFRALDGAEPVD